MRFDTLLVANRGEIALRVLRSARKLGLRTVAVYSDADAGSLHVREADLAVRIGPADAARSYRNGQALIEACRRSGAQAIHPGYGFLSENAEFARAVADAGLTFVGPSAEVIALMGNKAQAKTAMQKAGVPTVPGEQGCATDEQAAAAAERIGFPVILKAAAGGGGRGMRVVRDASGLAAALRQARSEALGAFGSDEIIIERAIVRGRHIEIQVLCDEHGRCLHLGERDCSTQRRFQKLVEEAPSPAVDAGLRRAMGEVAVRACEAIGYHGAGTLEFLLDDQGRFYFMEMNTRLQVEHGVTELVTGLDLVEQQLRMARGERLAFAQEDVRMRGHAIEVRLCAEDPAAGFLPQVGRVDLWRPSPDIRVDSALHDGMEIGSNYDSMVAKLMAWGETREESTSRLARACERTALLGVRTNLGLLSRCLRHPRFAAGEVTTDFLAGEEMGGPGWQARPSVHARAAAALLLAGAVGRDAHGLRVLPAGPGQARALWLADVTHTPAAESAELAAACAVELRPSADGRAVGIVLRPGEPVPLRDAKPGGKHDAELVVEVGNVRWEPVPGPCPGGTLGLAVDGVYRQLMCTSPRADEWWLQDAADSFVFRRLSRFEAGDAQSRDGSLRAPMSGRVIAVMVAQGDLVERGQTLAVLESMKMEMPLSAPRSGRVSSLSVREGMQLNAGQVLVEIFGSQERANG
ncbi:biotin carboxylase N-terminal domain-containing protein [Variovorax sp. DAIF25]|uniref:acetyl/propionyl/methylcrotonyl-CoA carboxylase subunit alpha n=1 Tax=Variovorax sp. DAIF25 TaxID=3080983 RepID=UPI003D6BADF6